MALRNFAQSGGFDLRDHGVPSTKDASSSFISIPIKQREIVAAPVGRDPLSLALLLALLTAGTDRTEVHFPQTRNLPQNAMPNLIQDSGRSPSVRPSVRR